MKAWHEDKWLLEAYTKNFEACLSEGGFDERRFADLMGAALVESEYAYRKEAFNEVHDEIMEAARDEYADLRRP